MKRCRKRLAFDLTEEEIARAEMFTDVSTLYYKYGATELLLAVPNYNLFKQIVEFISILEGTLNWQDAPTFT